MAASRRTLLFLLLFGLALLLGWLFPSFVMNNLIRPIALVVWLFVRVFVLTIDQQIYWAVLVIIALFFAFRRFQDKADAIESPGQWDANTAVENFNTWRACIRYTDSRIEYQDTVKRELRRLLVSMHVSQMYSSVYFIVQEDLKQRLIPLPESIHAFLFSDGPPGPEPFGIRILNAIRKAPSRWARRATGRDAVEYYQSVDEVLKYIEASMEIKHDSN